MMKAGIIIHDKEDTATIRFVYLLVKNNLKIKIFFKLNSFCLFFFLINYENSYDLCVANHCD